VFRPTQLGVIPTSDDSVRLEFNYDLIHTGDIAVEELTSEENKTIIVAVIKEYLEIE
jgi:hypothetical protein